MSPPLRCGATCDARSGGGAAELALLLRSAAQTTAASQRTKRGHAALPAPTARSALLGTSTGVKDETGHRFARPWNRGAARSRGRGRAQRWPVWLLHLPSGCAWGGALAGWRVQRSMHALRELIGRSCLSGAAQQQSEFLRPTPTEARRRFAPARSAGVADVGSPFFWGLFFGEAKKSASAAGPRPGHPRSFKHQRPTGAQRTNHYKFNSCLRRSP